VQTPDGAFHPTRFQDLAVTVDFHCNHACRFCIVQEGMNNYRGVGLERFAAMAAEAAVSGKYGRVIFTGGEVTLERKLFDFVAAARASKAFEHLRVQTHGRRFANLDFARALVGAGVDEYLVSIHGGSAAVHDDITQRPGSYDELVEGLRNLRALGARVITNTVINARNVTSLGAVVAAAAACGVREMEFWNYLPMEDFADERGLIAPMSAVVPALKAALDAAAALGVRCTVKYVPVCVLGEHGALVDNSQPDVLIEESFWSTFPRFNCLYEAVCEESERCLGLHHPYIAKYGWEESSLRPVPRVRPWAEASAAPEARPDRPEGGERPTEDAHAAWIALVDGAEAGLARRAGVQVTRNQARFRYEFTGGGALEVVLAPRDDARAALLRSRSFNVFYAGIEGAVDPQLARRLVTAAGARVVERDDGSLSLDPRKGLLPVVRGGRG
jgi:MoaA/NifB/PqqE/SkfB family radical SAM enzyme